MNPPVLALASASAAVTDIIGTAPVRCFAFGVVPAPPVGEPADYHLPCLTYKTLTSRPEQALGAPPAVERMRVRVEAWATDPDVAMALFDAAPTRSSGATSRSTTRRRNVTACAASSISG